MLRPRGASQLTPLPSNRAQRGRQQRVGVGDGPTAHGTAMHDQNVAEGIDVEEPAQPDARPPDPTPEPPTRGGQVLRGPAAAHFHDAYAIALLGEAVGGDAAAEPGADHNVIEVHHLPLGAPAQAPRETRAPPAGNPAGSLGISSPGFNTLSRMDVRECRRDFSGLMPINADPSMRVMDPNSSLSVMVSDSTKTPFSVPANRQ